MIVVHPTLIPVVVVLVAPLDSASIAVVAVATLVTVAFVGCRSRRLGSLNIALG